MQLVSRKVLTGVLCLMSGLLLSFLSVIGRAEMTVGVSILPQKYFVERIAGDLARTIVMVGPGHSPETYEPHPKQLAQLSHAKLYFLMGVPFENKWSRMFSTTNPNMKVISLAQGINLRKMESQLMARHESEADSHEHNELWDPHIWLNPRLVKQFALVIKTELIAADPANHSSYETNYQTFIRDLEKLDSFIRQQLANLRHKYFMVFHPTWGYFADEYGLVQVPIEYQGKQPGARALSNIIKLAEEKNIKAIFVQQQFSERDAMTIARQIGANLVRVDPLAENYIDNLEHVAHRFAEAMQ